MDCVALTRLPFDELVSAWGTDQNTPFQMALLCVFEAAPFLQPNGSVDVLRVRRELATRARSVPPLRRRDGERLDPRPAP